MLSNLNDGPGTVALGERRRLSLHDDLLDVPESVLASSGIGQGDREARHGHHRQQQQRHERRRQQQRRGSWSIDMPRLEGDDDVECGGGPRVQAATAGRRLSPPSPSSIENRPSLQRHRSSVASSNSGSRSPVSVDHEAEVAAGGRSRRASSNDAAGKTSRRASSSGAPAPGPADESSAQQQQQRNDSIDLYENARKNLFGSAAAAPPALASSVAARDAPSSLLMESASSNNREGVEIPAWMIEKLREQARRTSLSKRHSYHSACGSVEDMLDRDLDVLGDNDDEGPHDYDASGARLWASSRSVQPEGGQHRTAASIAAAAAAARNRAGADGSSGRVGAGRSFRGGGRQQRQQGPLHEEKDHEDQGIDSRVHLNVDFEEVEFYPSKKSKNKKNHKNGNGTDDSGHAYEGGGGGDGNGRRRSGPASSSSLRPKGGFSPLCYYAPHRVVGWCKVAVLLAAVAALVSGAASLLFPGESSGSGTPPPSSFLDSSSSSSSLADLALPPHIEANLADWSEYPVEDKGEGEEDHQDEKDDEDDEGKQSPVSDPKGNVSPARTSAPPQQQQPQPRQATNDVPLFWKVPLSGPTVAEEIFGTCLRLVQASEVGIADGHDADTTLMTVDVHGLTYLNVDTTTSAGIVRAKVLGLASSGLPDVISTSLLHDAASTLFDSTNRGRVLTVLRNPVDRAVATYHYLSQGRFKGPSGEDLDLASKSIEEYADSDFAEDNWMTRTLVNKPDAATQALTPADLDQAKAILRRKALVGLYSDLLGGVDLFVKYFGWGVSDWIYGGGIECAAGLIEDHLERERGEGEGGGGGFFPELSTGSVAFEKIVAKNEYDIQLYDYAVELHELQASQNGR